MSAPDAQTAAKTYCDRGNGGGSPSTLTTSTTEINCGRRSRSSMTKAPQTDRVGEIVVGPGMLRMVDQIAAASRRTPLEAAQLIDQPFEVQSCARPALNNGSASR